jgi:3-isopropylmalate/(R)-2-methylmalate dehydratase large subunit
MGMTVTEKIIAAHAGRDEVKPGEFVYANVDIALGNDITAPLAIKEFEAAGLTKVFDKDRIALIPDHFTPNKDIKSAEQCKGMREFAKEHDLKHYYEVGRCGVEHAFLPEQGIVVPGDLVIGADSHTCTYGALGAFATGSGSTDLAAIMATGKVWLRVPQAMKFTFTGKMPEWVYGKDLVLYTIGQIGVDGARYKSMEFAGDPIVGLNMDDRMCVCNMAIEAGGKNGIIVADDVTMEYEKDRAQREPRLFASDADAVYAESFEWDVSNMSPQIAMPHLPENTKPIEEVSDVTIDQVVIGSCTNGRMTDLRIAAELLKGKKISKDVRLIVIPATQEIWLQAMREGLLEIFAEAEAAVSVPTCGPCLGGHMGILAAGERGLATTNRNFVGRMGSPKSEVCLCSPAVAAASALTGKITHPADVV